MFGLNRFVFPTFPFVVGLLVAIATIDAFSFAKHSGYCLVYKPRQKVERKLAEESTGDFEATNTYSLMHPAYPW